MTMTQRVVRAVQRAMETEADVLSVSGRNGFYIIKSRTTLGEAYVLRHDHGTVECSCPAAARGFPCWHAESLKSKLIAESVTAVA